MGTVSKLQNRRRVALPISVAKRRIANISFDSDQVVFTDHAQIRMEERGISMPDVLRILRHGDIEDPPSEDHPGEWKCKVTDKLRGRTAGVVTVIIDADEQLIIVTVEWEDYR